MTLTLHQYRVATYLRAVSNRHSPLRKADGGEVYLRAATGQPLQEIAVRVGISRARVRDYWKKGQRLEGVSPGVLQAWINNRRRRDQRRQDREDARCMRAQDAQRPSV